MSDRLYPIDVLASAASGGDDDTKKRGRNTNAGGDSKNKPDPHLAAAQRELTAAHERERRAREVLDETRKRVEDLERQLDEARRDRSEAERTHRDSEEAVRRAAGAAEELELKRPCAWNRMYNELVAYKEEHGDTLVPHPHRTIKNPALDGLGRWVGNQRVYYKYYMNSGDTKRINPHRIAALESIGFVWDVFEYKWNKNIKQLIEFRDANGHCNVPRTYPPNQDLANWVESRRVDWRKRVTGRPSNLTEGRLSELKLLGFRFPRHVPRYPGPSKSKRNRVVGADAAAADAIDSGGEEPSAAEVEVVAPVSKFDADEFWETRYQDMAAFHAKHGHCQVHNRSIAKEEGYTRLTIWAAQQKREYINYLEGKPSILNPDVYPDRIQRLNELNFPWRKPPSEPRRAPNSRRQPGSPPGRRKKRKIDGSDDKAPMSFVMERHV